jgi:cation diffusion facilitator family transporter
VRIGRRFEFPPEQQRLRERVKRLEWMSLALLTVAAFLIWLTLGQSQALKTAWISDLLTLIPPVAILVALRFDHRRPSERFPYGYFRAISIAFLATAVLIAVAGLWLLYEAVTKLVARERPPIGSVELFGRELWAGWPMIAALATTVAIGFTLGQLKRPVAEALHDKTLEGDADMNKANWSSEGAAIVGILLVGFGYWWGDAVAAGLIPLHIVRDGWHNLRQVLGDLMDESPTKLGGKELEDLPHRIKDAAEGMPWVREAAVRLREQGHVLSGEVFVVPRDGAGAVDLSLVERASEDLRALDWRLYNLTVMPVSSIEQ